MTGWPEANGDRNLTAVHVPFVDLSSMTAELADELAAAWHEVVRSSAFVGGEYVRRFEHDWASYCGRAHAVGVGNGTDALHLALRALGIGRGDEVLVPTNTFVATAEAVVASGATPVFVDVDPATLLLSCEGAKASITARTAALIVVDLFGQPHDMDQISEVARAAGLVLLEDAAQAHGATWNGRRAGSFGHASCFSFYPGKNLGAFGDGGAVLTDDAELARRIRSLGDHGRTAGSPFHHDLPGFNSRLDGLQAAILSVKLQRLDKWNASRRRISRMYREGLSGEPVMFVEIADGAESAHHLEVIRTGARDELREDLARQGIATGIHYPIPCHLQPAFAGYRAGPLPVAEAAATAILSLPMYPHLADRQVSFISDTVRQVLSGRDGCGASG